MRYLLIALVVISSSAALAGERHHLITTQGGVQRLAVEPAPRQRLQLPTTVQPAPAATTSYQHPAPRNAPTHYAAPSVHRAAVARPNMVTDIATSAVNTAQRTTRNTLNREINNEIRRSLRNAIQF